MSHMGIIGQPNLSEDLGSWECNGWRGARRRNINIPFILMFGHSQHPFPSCQLSQLILKQNGKKNPNSTPFPGSLLKLRKTWTRHCCHPHPGVFGAPWRLRKDPDLAQGHGIPSPVRTRNPIHPRCAI